MSKDKEYCPDCCVELVKINKRLDKTDRRIWMRCTNCGFTKRPANSTELNKAIDEFNETHKLKSTNYRVNLNKYF